MTVGEGLNPSGAENLHTKRRVLKAFVTMPRPGQAQSNLPPILGHADELFSFAEPCFWDWTVPAYLDSFEYCFL